MENQKDLPKKNDKSSTTAQRIRWAALFAFTIGHLLLAGLIFHQFTGLLYRKNVVVEREKLHKSRGHSYKYKLERREEFPAYGFWKIRLYEDGQRIDSKHFSAAAKKFVEVEGSGKTFVNNRTVRFSNRDGSDIFTNGREYILNVPRSFKSNPWWIGATLAALGWFGLFALAPIRSWTTGWLSRAKNKLYNQISGGFFRLKKRKFWRSWAIFVVLFLLIICYANRHYNTHELMPATDADSWQWLLPALQIYDGERPNLGEQPPVYPLFLGIALRFNDDIQYISIWQKYLLIASSALLSLMFVWIFSKKTTCRWRLWLAMLAAGVLFSWITLASQSIFAVRMISPHALSTSLISIFVALIGYIAVRFFEKKTAKKALYLLCFTAITLTFTEWRFFPFVAIVVLLLLWSLRWNQANAKKQIINASICTIFLLGVFNILNFSFKNEKQELFTLDRIENATLDGQYHLAKQNYQNHQLPSPEVVEKLPHEIRILLNNLQVDQYEWIKFNRMRQSYSGFAPTRVLGDLAFAYGYFGGNFYQRLPLPEDMNFSTLRNQFPLENLSHSQQNIVLPMVTFANLASYYLKRNHPPDWVLESCKILDDWYLPLLAAFACFALWRFSMRFFSKKSDDFILGRSTYDSFFVINILLQIALFLFFFCEIVALPLQNQVIYRSELPLVLFSLFAIVIALIAATVQYFRKYPWVFFSIALFSLVVLLLQHYNTYELMPSIDGDSWGYLLPVMNFYENGTITVNTKRPFLYPLMLSLATTISGKLTAITFLQEWLSILSSLAVAYFFPWFFSKIKNNHSWLYAGMICGLLFFILMGFSAQAIRYARFVRPESISISLMAFFFCLLGIFIIRSLQKKRSFFVIIVLGLLSAMIFFTKQNWSFAMAVAPLAIFSACWWNKKYGIKNLIVGFFACLVPFLAMYFYNNFLGEKYDSVATKTFVPQYLVGFHQNIAEPAIREMLKENNTEEKRIALQAILNIILREKEYSHNFPSETYKKIHIIPERFLFEEIGLRSIADKLPSNLDDRAALFNEIFIRSIKMHPLDYAKKVLGQLAYYYSPFGQVYHTGFNSVEQLNEYSRNCIPKYHQFTEKQLQLVQPLENHINLPAEHLKKKHPPTVVLIAHQILEAIFWPMLVFFGIYTLLRIYRLIFQKNRTPCTLIDAIWLLALFSQLAVFGVNLSFALMSSLAIDRFISYTISLTLASHILIGVLITLLLFQVFSKKMRSKKSKSITPQSPLQK